MRSVQKAFIDSLEMITQTRLTSKKDNRWTSVSLAFVEQETEKSKGKTVSKQTMGRRKYHSESWLPGKQTVCHTESALQICVFALFGAQIFHWFPFLGGNSLASHSISRGNGHFPTYADEEGKWRTVCRFRVDGTYAQQFSCVWSLFAAKKKQVNTTVRGFSENFLLHSETLLLAKADVSCETSVYCTESESTPLKSKFVVHLQLSDLSGQRLLAWQGGTFAAGLSCTFHLLCKKQEKRREGRRSEEPLEGRFSSKCASETAAQKTFPTSFSRFAKAVAF